MTVEAIRHKSWYIEHDNLALSLPPLETGETFPERYALFAQSSASSVFEVYDQETFRCFTTNSYCGLWQMHHLASVIARPIISVFPEFDDEEDIAPLRYYHNRIIVPRCTEHRRNQPVVIMWTKASNFSTDVANHFVAVVK